jgi:hypothetical protein
MGLIVAVAIVLVDVDLNTAKAILAGRVSAANIGIILLDVTMAYVGGIAIGVTFAAAWTIDRLCRQGRLVVRPFHPDGCSGLSAIGQVYLSITLILALIGLFLGGWLVFAHVTNTNISAFFIANFQKPFIASLVVVILLGVGAYYLLVHSVREQMQKQSAAARASLAAMGVRLAELEEVFVRESPQQSPEQLKADNEHLDRLRTAYGSLRDLPTWPIEWRSLKGFVLSVSVVGGYLTGAMKAWEQLKPHVA